MSVGNPTGISLPQQGGTRAQKAAAVAGGGVLLAYFIVTLLPISKEIAGLRLSPLRIVLLALFVPYLVQIFQGKAGRLTRIDMLMMGHAFWIVLALVMVHGVQRIAFAGITTVELVGGYFLGRVLIRDPASYRRMVMILLGTMIFLLPFAVVELFTGRLVIPQILGKVFETIYRGNSAYGRMGMERVYGVFEHPILFGLYCSVAIANLFYVLRGKLGLRLMGMIFAGGMTFMSLSSAPLISVGLQVMLILWDKITKSAWVTFMVLAVLGYVTIDALSNRTPVTIIIETMTFNAGTGWTRIAIFESGIAAAQNHPFFGIGFNDWPRPHWLTESVDNFWLLTTMRYGFVGSGFLVFAFVFHLYQIMKTPIVDVDARRMRTGYGITLVAICFTLTTVHVWGSLGVFVMFYLGAGGWFYTNDVITMAPEDSAPAAAPEQLSRYTRFTPSHSRTL